jgi:heat shock protein HslJ
MKTFKTLSLFTAAILLALTGCKKENNPEPEPTKPFVITDHFVAGTLTPRSGSKYTSVFFIQLLEDQKALFINSSTNNLVGTYTLSETELVFEVMGGNARIAKFTLDKDKKITSAYYKALTMESDATGELLEVKESNELAGKKFKGDEFKIGELSNRPGLVYSFNKAGTTTYGSGIDAATIDNSANNYTLIGGNGFKYVNGSTVELGFVSNKKLTAFRSSGLFYYGKYDQQ